MRMTLYRLSAAVLIAVLCARTARAETWLYRDLVGASAQTDSQHFGTAIAADRYADGSIRALYVGVPNADVTVDGTTYTAAGSVHVFTPKGGWHLSAVLSDYGPQTKPQAYAHYGAAVAVHNGIVVIGAPDWDAVNYGINGVGYVVVFQDANAGNPAQPEPDLVKTHSLFYSSAAGANAHRGHSVAVDGDPATGAFVAFGASNYGGSNGAVDVYRIQGAAWASAGNFYSSTAENFGASVAIHADSGSSFHLVVGAPGKAQGSALLAGEARVYVPNNGDLALAGTLKAQNPAFLDAFGTAVAITSDRVYVGGTGRHSNGGKTGSVSVFVPANISGYDFDTELFPTGGADDDYCGAALAFDPMHTNRLAVGCPGSDGLVAGEGFVRVYTRGSLFGSPFWFQDRIDMSDIPHGADDMGRSVLIDSDRVYAGTPLDDYYHGTDTGVVRFFVRDHIFADGLD